MDRARGRIEALTATLAAAKDALAVERFTLSSGKRVDARSLRSRIDQLVAAAAEPDAAASDGRIAAMLRGLEVLML